MSEYDGENTPGYLRTLPGVVAADLDRVTTKDREYGASWKKRGGTGAFMMLARKWDRLEEQAKQHNWDVFKAVVAGGTSENVLDTIRDLRGYLLLVEADLLARNAVPNADSMRGVHATELADRGQVVNPPAAQPMQEVYRQYGHIPTGHDEHGPSAPVGGFNVTKPNGETISYTNGLKGAPRYAETPEPIMLSDSCEWRS